MAISFERFCLENHYVFVTLWSKTTINKELYRRDLFSKGQAVLSRTLTDCLLDSLVNNENNNYKSKYIKPIYTTDISHLS